MDELTRKIKQYIEEKQMLKPGDGVIAALSGGADSVCLLLVLAELAQSQGWELRALHVHHGLRGEEADRDKAFVRELCEKREISLKVCHYQVEKYAKEHRLSVEEAGRKLRYEAFEQEAAAWEKELIGYSEGKVRIAVAHHMDDQAETVLHHMMRGSGLRGLAGIRPVQERRIRPLLCVKRSEILAYLKTSGQSWMEDSTNQHEDYTRNRIRHHLIPQMVEEVNVHSVENIVHAASMFAQADDYLMLQAARVMQAAGMRWEIEKAPETGDEVSARMEKDPGKESVLLEQPVLEQSVPEQKPCDRIWMPLNALKKEPEIMQSYIVRRMLDLTARHQKDLTAEHFRQILMLAEKQVGARCDLPGDLVAERTYQDLYIGHGRPQQNKEISEKTLKMRTFSYQKGMDFPKNQYTKWFDYDKIRGTLSVRTRQSGDYITLTGGGQKSVNRYMIDEKIPKEQRDSILLLAEGSHVLWIIGYRISEYYKIIPQTERVLEASVNGGENYV